MGDSRRGFCHRTGGDRGRDWAQRRGEKFDAGPGGRDHSGDGRYGHRAGADQFIAGVGRGLSSGFEWPGECVPQRGADGDQ